MIWRQIIQLSFLKAPLPCFDKTQIVVLMVPDFTSLLSCLCQEMVFPLQILAWHRVSMLSTTFNIPSLPSCLPFFNFFFNLTAIKAADSQMRKSAQPQGAITSFVLKQGVKDKYLHLNRKIKAVFFKKKNLVWISVPFFLLEDLTFPPKSYKSLLNLRN